MGDVDDPAHPEDQRQAGTDEKQAGRGGKPVKSLKEKSVEAHRRGVPASTRVLRSFPRKRESNLASIRMGAAAALGPRFRGDERKPWTALDIAKG